MPAFAGFAIVGSALLWLAFSGLLPVVRALESHAPLISLSPRDAIGFPLAISFFALAALTLFPVPDLEPGRRRRSPRAPRRNRFDGAAFCLGTAVLGAVSTPLASPLTVAIIQNEMSKHNYLRCPPVPGERTAYLRWMLIGPEPSEAKCPVAKAPPSP